MTATRVRPHRPFAEETTVPAERTRVEIERLLQRRGASEFAVGWREGGAFVGFRLGGRLVRIMVPLPPVSTYTRGASGRLRSQKGQLEAQAQEERRRWRALLLVLKANLEAVDSGIMTLEEAFLPFYVLPNGQTVAERLLPQYEALQASGQLPSLLPGLPGGGSP